MRVRVSAIVMVKVNARVRDTVKVRVRQKYTVRFGLEKGTQLKLRLGQLA